MNIYSGLLTTTNAAGDIVDPYVSSRGTAGAGPGTGGAGGGPIYGQTGPASAGVPAANTSGDYGTAAGRGGGGPAAAAGGGRFYSPQYNSASYSQQNGVSIPPNERDRYANY